MVAPKRKSLSAKDREKIFLAADGICHICGFEIDPIRERWDADHVNPREITGKDDLDEFRPAHKSCHIDKTKEDVRVIRKGQRIRQKHMGIKKQKAGGFRGWRRMDGTIKWRDEK